MANQYKNKIIYNGEPLIDLTSDTVSAATLLNGETAHDKSGAPIIGTYVPFSPSGNIDITQAGITNVTNYATATVSEGSLIGLPTFTVDPTITINEEGLVEASYEDYSTVTPVYQSGWIDSSETATAFMYGYNTYQLSTQAATTITPTESSQTAVTASKYTTGAVTVAAIPSDYVGSGITRRDVDEDVYQQGDTVYIPGGYYDYNSVYIIPGGTTTAPTSISGTAATVSTGTNTLTLTKTVSVTPRVTTAGYVTTGTDGNSSVSLTANVTTKAAATITPGTSNQTIASGTYLTGTQTISGDADLVAGNIKTGVNIFGVAGSYTADATAAADDILSGQTAYVNGSKITGTLEVQNFYTGSSTPAANFGNNGDLYLQVIT